MTEIKARDGKLYVSAIFDCFDLAVVGLAMDTNMKATLCEKTLENAYKAYPAMRGCILHSDRGSQYTSELGDRWLPLTQRAKEIISRVQEINKEYGYSCNGLLFSRKGTLLSPDTIDAQIKRGSEYIGIPVKTMHKIRKTYASTLLHNEVNVSIVKDMLGHADQATTLKHYIFNTEEEVETDNIVLSVLEGEKKNVDESEKVDDENKSEQKIILFSDMKKARNL